MAFSFVSLKGRLFEKEVFMKVGLMGFGKTGKAVASVILKNEKMINSIGKNRGTIYISIEKKE